MKEINVKILSHTDHTLFGPNVTKDDIILMCDEAAELRPASICIPPCYVEAAYEYLTKDRFAETGNPIHIGTIVGFPDGTATTLTKVYEAVQAVRDGANEIDLIINRAMITQGEYAYISNEIVTVRNAINEEARKRGKELPILKVSFDAERTYRCHTEAMCNVCAITGADFIKASIEYKTEGISVLSPSETRMMDSTAAANKLYGTNLKVAVAANKPYDAINTYIDSGIERMSSSSIVDNIMEDEYERKTSLENLPALNYDDGKHTISTVIPHHILGQLCYLSGNAGDYPVFSVDAEYYPCVIKEDEFPNKAVALIKMKYAPVSKTFKIDNIRLIETLMPASEDDRKKKLKDLGALIETWCRNKTEIVPVGTYINTLLIELSRSLLRGSST